MVLGRWGSGQRSGVTQGLLTCAMPSHVVLAAFGKNQKVSDNDHLETAGKTKLTATVRCDRLGLRTNQANTPNGANRERAGRP